MRSPVALQSFLTALVVLAAANCAGDGTGPEPGILLTTPDFTAMVSKVEFQSGPAPGVGFQSQYNIWGIIAPATVANVGVVVPSAHSRVYLRAGDPLVPIDPADIRLGDRIEVWHHEYGVAYGTVQAPPDAPAYAAEQIVVVR